MHRKEWQRYVDEWILLFLSHATKVQDVLHTKRTGMSGSDLAYAGAYEGIYN